jgi:CRP-like cAMP-binding protein
MERKEALRRVLFLKTLPEAVIAAVAAAGEERTLRKGEMLFTENAPCIGLIVVLTGAVKVYKTDSRGREITLGLEESGASVAELPLFDGGNYPANSEGAKENTTVLIIPRERFQHLMVMYPEVAVQALRALAIRMRRQVKMIEAQAMHTVRARLAAYLLRIAAGRSTFLLEETNEAISSQIGTVREVVSRTLGNLREMGAITLRGRRVTILDTGSLRYIAEAGEHSKS